MSVCPCQSLGFRIGWELLYSYLSAKKTVHTEQEQLKPVQPIREQVENHRKSYVRFVKEQNERPKIHRKDDCYHWSRGELVSRSKY